MSPRRLVWFFDRINSFKMVAVVFALVLAINGYLLYRKTETLPVSPSSSTATSEVAKPAELSAATANYPEAQEPSTTIPAEESEKSETTPETRVGSGTAVAEASSRDGLEEAVLRCREEQDECVREAIPEARYIGGRMDLNANFGGHNEEVLYLKAPGLGACEYSRQEYEAADGPVTTVILVGSGSFESKAGAESIPPS